MPMLPSLLAMAVIVMWAWPETSIARRLRRLLVDAPLAFAGRLERRHIVFLLLVALVLSLGAEFFVATGSADLAVALIWQASAWIDASLAMAVVTAFGRGGDAIAHGVRLCRRTSRRGFRRRARVQRRPTARPRTKDEPHRSFLPVSRLGLAA